MQRSREVAVGSALPLAGGDDSLLVRTEHALKPWVACAIVPIFVFANAGVALGRVSLATPGAPVALGIIAGFFLGKQQSVRDLRQRHGAFQLRSARPSHDRPALWNRDPHRYEFVHRRSRVRGRSSTRFRLAALVALLVSAAAGAFVLIAA